METKNTLTQFLLSDENLIHDLNDIIGSNSINDTITILNGLKFQIYHTCDMMKKLTIRPDASDIIYIINDNILDQSKRSSFLFNEIFVSVKKSAKDMFHHIKGKTYKRISEILVEDENFMNDMYILERVPVEHISKFIFDNEEDIMFYAFESIRKDHDGIHKDPNYEFIVNIINSTIVIIDDIKDSLTMKTFDDIIRSLKEFILLDVHNRAVKNLDYSALYLQTVDEYDATINWLKSCHIRYDVDTNEQMNQITIKMVTWYKNSCLFSKYEGIDFIFNKETHELIRVNSYS